MTIISGRLTASLWKCYQPAAKLDAKTDYSLLIPHPCVYCWHRKQTDLKTYIQLAMTEVQSRRSDIACVLTWLCHKRTFALVSCGYAKIAFSKCVVVNASVLHLNVLSRNWNFLRFLICLKAESEVRYQCFQFEDTTSKLDSVSCCTVYEHRRDCVKGIELSPKFQN